MTKPDQRHYLGLVIAIVMCGCSSATPPPVGPILGETQTRSLDGMVMVAVPSGQFQTGRDNTNWHTAQVNGFWIDKTEVTDAQYRICMAAGVCEAPWRNHSGTEPYFIQDVYALHPVVFVGTDLARTYCEWAGARLPTEDEWSFAARGPNSYTYPWGNTFDGTRLNYCDINCPTGEADNNVNDGYARTAPVGSYPTGASWVGALDMSGNVWELTSAGVVLGGSWFSRAANARTGSGYDFGGGGLDYGFRCAADLPDVKCIPITNMDYSDNTKVAILLQEYVSQLPGVKSVSYTIPERLYSNTLSQLVLVNYTNTDGEVYAKRFIVYFEEFGWQNAVFSIDGQCWIDPPY